MLLASASSFRGTQHGAHHHHPLTYHQSSPIYGAGGATPETSALYQSLGSINVTGSTNSNNPYIGVRMTPETTQLQPQSVAHRRSSEADPRTAVLETNTHSLSARDTQPLELPLLRESNQYETGFKEAQQRWMTAALPTQVVPLYANGSRHSNPQSSPLTAALGESNRNSSSTARTASADYAIVTNRLQELMPPAITPNESTGLEPRSTVHQREQQQQQQQRPFSLPSHSGTPHEGCVRSYSPRSAAQQQRATPQQPALYISPSHAVAMSTMGLTTVSRGTSMGDTSRSHSVARGATGQLSPLSTIASTVSPVPLAEVELVPDIYNSSSLTDSIAEDEVHRQQETSRTRSPHRPCTAVGRARPRYAAHSPLSTPPPYHDVCADALNSTQTELLSDTEPRLTPASAGTSAGLLSPRQQSNHHAASACSAEDEKVHDYSDVRRPFQHSYGGASPAKEMAAHMLEEAEAPKNRQSPSAQLVPAGATNPDNDAAQAPQERDTLLRRSVDRAQVENDVEDSDKEEKGDDDDGDEGSVATADPAQTSKGKKKRRVRRNRKAKVLEDLPPVTSMKYLPPPPPPVTSVLLDLAGAASTNASSPSAFDKYYAVLLRWYTRLLADEADVVDTANACSFDATTAAAAMGAEACQIRGGSYAAAGKPPSGWLLQSLHSGPISPPMGPISPTLMSNPAPAYFGGSGGNAEVHVRCPRIEQYMALCDIPAELRLALTPNTAVKLPGGNKAEATAETQVIGSATVVLPQSVKDVPSAVRWAHDLETWWFCYVFPHVAHTRHQPPATWPPPQQQQQPASMSPVGLTISHPGAGTVGYDYSYGWPTTMSQPMISPIPVAYGAHGSCVIDGTHPMIGNGISSSVYEHIPMQPQLPAPLPPMPPGYLMSVYSAY
ncbi:hypothetical protein, conserved [Leishmania shawi]|uniref:GPI-anchored surface protein n=1 Tax=Leishmania shawi TaxID=5680 RepID=A0ABR3ECI1_9TRYP